MTIGCCVIYRWTVVADRERQFRDAWESMTRELRKHAGALGSRLHRCDDGTWVAYAQWPNREAWEKATVETDAATKAMAEMSAAILQRFEPEFLEPLSDLLVAQSE
jgi:quinol monooxygenase YgiN